jgi:copper homeostasis protein
MGSVLVEVCVDSVASAIAAERGRASRIELCSGLIEGGITPSAGLIATVRSAVSIPLHVMIRPRGGDFCYDSAELDAMRRDIALAGRIGANGVVFGILNVDAQVDVARMRELVALARPLEVTFHRAFDMAADFSRALEDVCESGVSRLLTSGGEQTSLLGQGVIAELVKQARGRVIVMLGSGIKAENARGIVEHTGAREIHVGLRSTIESPMVKRNTRIIMGTIPGREYLRAQVIEESVRTLCDAVAGAS